MHWTVDNCIISLIHVDTRLHTTTSHFPKIGDADATVMKETLEDLNKLIKCSITKISYEE